MLAIWRRTPPKSWTCSSASNAFTAPTVDRQDVLHCRRSSKASRSPTLCAGYTTAAFTSTPSDVRLQGIRNKQWNGVSAPLKGLLSRRITVESGRKSNGSTAHADQSSINSEAVTSDDMHNNPDWASVQRVAGMELSDEDILYEDHISNPWEDLELSAMQTPEWPANTGPRLERYKLPPQSLWSLESMRLTAMRKRYTWKKLAIQTHSIGLLVHKLMREAIYFMRRHGKKCEIKTLSAPLQQLAILTPAQAWKARKVIQNAIERLQVIPVESSAEEIAEASPQVNLPAIPMYYQDDDGDFHAICAQMNEAIKKLFSQSPERSDRDEGPIIAKICHNLIVSTASPDLQTFNILLAGFKRWGRPRLVDNVISAFGVSKIRPNEITCREILDHYASELRPDDFSRFVAKMRGIGGALMLANSSIDPIYENVSQGRLVRVSKTKVYQKVYPTPMVFSALIDGVMRFAGFDRALDVYYELKADGWGLDVQGLTKLLRDCIRRGDWEAGMYLWEEISIVKWNANPRDMARAYYHMLALCSITGNTVSFNQILQEVVKRKFDSKSIINAATRTAQQAQGMSEKFAPAWAADNVLIAVSDYIHDAKRGGSNEVPPPESLESEPLFDELAPEEPGTASQKEAAKKELWASWVEAEFGERPKDPEL